VSAEEPEVRAAGGVVLRERQGAAEVAVVHRPKYDDWSLPKGKLTPGETYEQAALREVAEETGLECELEAELSSNSYRDGKGRAKLVRWWLMRAHGGAFDAGSEVDEMRWVPLEELEELLDYAADRALVREALALRRSRLEGSPG
jgi:8-oxo-dGTP diphosphatase